MFHAARPLPVGLNAELAIAWPVLLHNVAPMQLVVSGRIVRSEGLRAAIQITAHEFRTAGVGAMAATAPTSGALINSAFAHFNKFQ